MRGFPALYRMPVAYLLGLVTLATLWAAARPRSDGASLASPGLGAGLDGLAATVSPPARPVAIDPPDAILRTADGLRRKVVVRALDVVPRPKPDAAPVGKPLDYFAIRFLHGERPDLLQVGGRAGPPDGWIARESALEWDTRLMARPTPRPGRPTLDLYAEQACLASAVAGRACPTHGSACPREGEEAGLDGPPPVLGWPILKTESVPGPDGSRQAIHEVALLVADAGQPVPTAKGLDALQPALRNVYVAVAIDTTASMQATIDAAKAVATDLAAEVSRSHAAMRLHLALVEYRDDSPGFGFKARLVTPFTDPANFRAVIETLRAATRGDNSVDEAVLDGVALALPGTPGGLRWPAGRAGDLATKLLVLLGDAPDHAHDLARSASLAARARASGIAIAAISLDRPHTLSRDEASRFEAQWRTLAEGSFRPDDSARGVAGPGPALLFRVDSAGGLGPRLQALIDDRVDRARSLVALAAAEAEGRLAEYVDSRGLTLRQVAPVLVDLHRGEARPTARPDPRSDGRKAPSVRRAWVAETIGPARMVEIEVLMSRDELDALIGELAALQQAATGEPGDLNDLLAIGNAAATGETSFLAADRGGQTFADHLRRRRNLPASRTDGLLDRTQTDLLRADPVDRAALDARLRTALLGLTRRRNAADWSDPLRTVEGMAGVPYDLIDF